MNMRRKSIGMIVLILAISLIISGCVENTKKEPTPVETTTPEQTIEQTPEVTEPTVIEATPEATESPEKTTVPTTVNKTTTPVATNNTATPVATNTTVNNTANNTNSST